MAPRSSKSSIPREVKKLGKIFSDAGYGFRIVGGWVRDTLRGIDPKDLDLATTATPEQMAALFTANNLRYFPTGIGHGTMTVLPTVKMKTEQQFKSLALDYKRAQMHPEIVPAYEITTLRIDVETDGRHALVEYTTDWQKDAERRDFTINAMSMDLKGELFDYFDGQQHLSDKRIVFVGDAQARIREDYLRILRFFRFRSRIGDRSYDRGVRHTIAANVDGLKQISVERIWMEMSKILSGDSTMLCLMLIDMLETGVLEHIGLPDVERYDLVHATIVRDQTSDPLTVLAALTPDDIGESWRMSRHEIDLLRFLQRHRRIPRPDLAFFKEIAFDHGYRYAVECASLFGPSEVLEQIRDWTPIDLPVTGEDLIQLGHPPGPSMGVILKRLTRIWKDSDYQMGRSSLLAQI